ncbi:hypothetical protein [Sphingobacterium multivorum]|uniref:hypothetical protein n=1 Tax=Sphingobacterium multivorum TaxID=28454 RepID=UPI0028AC831A|nr:hypothetical protein [Sphingobacterium multivorum]
MSIDKKNNYDFGIVGLGVMVLIGKVSFTHFGIKEKKLEGSINILLKHKKRLLYQKAAFYN